MANQPKRIQLKRTKGWRMPPNTVKVDRSTRWGNPFKVGDPHPSHGWPISHRESVDLFRERIGGGWDKSLWLADLRGKNLACWCPLDQPCHADVLLELANSGGEGG